MNDKKFKVGDKVRIINCITIESYELNEIGTIVEIRDNDDSWVVYVVDMGRPRRPNEDETCWYLNGKHIELSYRPNQQLLFSFMKQRKE